MNRFLLSLLLTLLIHTILSKHPVFAHHNKPTENTVKTACIYNFAKLVEWPETVFKTPDAPLILGIIGDGPMTKSLLALENKMVRGRPISIKRIPSPTTTTACHILYITADQSNSLETILSAFRDLPCLTVSSIDGFARQGGMINFIHINNKIRFEINLGATRLSTLKVSSRLLKIAIIVGEISGGGNQ